MISVYIIGVLLRQTQPDTYATLFQHWPSVLSMLLQRPPFNGRPRFLKNPRGKTRQFMNRAVCLLLVSQCTLFTSYLMKQLNDTCSA